MHGRMIHGQRGGKLFEESQLYDIHGRVCTSSNPKSETNTLFTVPTSY